MTSNWLCMIHLLPSQEFDFWKRSLVRLYSWLLTHSWYEYWSPSPQLLDLRKRTQVSKALLSMLNRTESRKQSPEKVCIGPSGWCESGPSDLITQQCTMDLNLNTKVFWCRDSCGGARSTSPSSTSTSPSWSCSATPSGNQPQYYLASSRCFSALSLASYQSEQMPLNPVTSHLS